MKIQKTHAKELICIFLTVFIAFSAYGFTVYFTRNLGTELTSEQLAYYPKLPQGTKFVRGSGTCNYEFCTNLAKDEVEKFFQDYLSPLEKVRLPNSNGEAYFDKENNYYVFYVNIYRKRFKTYFWISMIKADSPIL